MAVSAKVERTAPRCKLCKHEKRPEIDAMLARRSQREVTLEDCLAQFAEWGIENPNIDNIKTHLGQKGGTPHTVIVGEEEVQATEEAHAAVIEGLRDRIARGERLNPEEVLDTLIAQGMAELELRILATGHSGVTVDQMLKAIDSKTKRKQNEAQDELLRSLSGGIGMVFEKALGGPPTAAGELEQEVPVEAEFTEVEE